MHGPTLVLAKPALLPESKPCRLELEIYGARFHVSAVGLNPDQLISIIGAPPTRSRQGSATKREHLLISHPDRSTGVSPACSQYT